MSENVLLNLFILINLFYAASACTLVVDNGSQFMKAGVSGDDAPGSVFITMIGRPKHGHGSPQEFYVGVEAFERQNILDLKRPIQRGLVTNWDDMQNIWSYTFSTELRVSPEECNVLLSVAPLCPHADLEKMAKIMFETFNTPAIDLVNQAVLSLYASGRTTGVVVESGYEVTHIVPIYNGKAIDDAILQFDMGGRDVTDYLLKLFRERGYAFSTDERAIVADVKEKFSYVARNFQEELERFDTTMEEKYELPDGQIIIIGNERFRAPEIMFQPSMVGKEPVGIHEVINNSIMKCDISLRRELYFNIILAGGNTMFHYLDYRLSHELRKLVPSNFHLKVVGLPERKYLTWIGGSTLSSLSTFAQNWITKEEYNEFGASIVHQKKQN